MSDPIKKEDLKKVFIESLEPFASAIKQDFDRVDKKLDEIKTDVAVNKVNIQEGFKEAKKERAEIKAKVNETYDAVDGFIKVVDKLDTEFTVIKEDLKRVKEVIKEKLGVDLT
jgi:septation ring formation regulator EzrA